MKHLPNILTLSRIPLLFIIVGLLCIDGFKSDLSAFILFILAAASDWFDGYIARKVGAVSNFGKLMDALTDKIIMVGLFVAMLGLKCNAPAGTAETILPQFCVFFVIIIICCCKGIKKVFLNLVLSIKNLDICAQNCKTYAK